jgi:prolyl-tRNA synthetase
VVLPGDREVNEAKLRKILGTSEVKFANDVDFAAAGGVRGFIGPVGLKVRTLVDTSVDGRAYIAGANRNDLHLRDVVYDRDFKGERVDAHDVRDGDLCPKCGKGHLEIKRGVEVGNIFAYGTYYSDKMNATFLAEDGTRKPFVGGSYGIGVGRAVQTIIETHNDDKGIVWPPQVAPYHVHVLALPVNDEGVRAKSEALVADLGHRGIEVLYDDRDESAGVKFADADLIGIPLRVTVSKRNLKENAAELKLRSSSDSQMVPLDEAGPRIAEIVASWPR